MPTQNNNNMKAYFQTINESFINENREFNTINEFNATDITKIVVYPNEGQEIEELISSFPKSFKAYNQYVYVSFGFNHSTNKTTGEINESAIARFNKVVQFIKK